MATILAYVAGAVVAAWGVTHAVPTGQVLAGFEPITTANRRIILQELATEGVEVTDDRGSYSTFKITSVAQVDAAFAVLLRARRKDR